MKSSLAITLEKSSKNLCFVIVTTLEPRVYAPSNLNHTHITPSFSYTRKCVGVARSTLSDEFIISLMISGTSSSFDSV